MAKLPFSFESIEILDAIDRRGSYAAAADELNKVPSALSYATQKLEEQLGVTLFQKQGRRAVLTASGRYFLDHGRQLLHAAHDITDKTKQLNDGLETRLNLTIDTIIDPSIVYKVLHEFCHLYPSVEIDIQEQALGGGWELLVNDETQLLIGATAPIPEQKGIKAMSWFTTERVFAVAPGHPLAKLNRPLSRQDINQHKMLVVHDTSKHAVPRSINIFEGAPAVYVPTLAHKILAQCHGVGGGFLPKARVQHLLAAKQLIALEVEHIDSPLSSQQYLAWKIVNKGKALKALVAMLHKTQES